LFELLSLPHVDEDEDSRSLTRLALHTFRFNLPRKAVKDPQTSSTETRTGVTRLSQKQENSLSLSLSLFLSLSSLEANSTKRLLEWTGRGDKQADGRLCNRSQARRKKKKLQTRPEEEEEEEEKKDA